MKNDPLERRSPRRIPERQYEEAVDDAHPANVLLHEQKA